MSAIIPEPGPKTNIHKNGISRARDRIALRAAEFKLPKRRRAKSIRSRIVTASDWPANLRCPAFYVPVNLALEDFEPGHRIYAAWLLNLIRWRWICWKADDDGHTHLMRRYLQRVIPDDVFRVILDRLVGLSVIFPPTNHVPGESARGYKLTPAFRTAKRIEIRDIDFARKLQRIANEKHLLPVHRKLNSWLSRIEFDWVRAQRIISRMIPDASSPMPVDDYRLLIAELCRPLVDGVVEIDSVDAYGRVHSVVTRLPTELRCCLHVEGQPLVSLDLRNSQPLMAGIVAAQFYRNRDAARRLRDRKFSDDRPTYHNRMPDTITTDRPDLLDYLEVCQSGTVYESLMNPGDSRDQVKVEFLVAMYSRNEQTTDLKRILKERYPSVANMLVDLKRNNYRHAAHLMQNLESVIFIHGICSKLLDTGYIPVYTIHDAILTTGNHSKQVYQVMKQVFASVGLKPSIKTGKTTPNIPSY